jgi:threonine dehydrogenase-like Zn-dependent dehydrogenase
MNTTSSKESERQISILAITAPRTLTYLQRELPAPGPGEVRVQTIFSGISHGTEMNVYRGLDAGRPGVGLSARLRLR